MTGLALFLTTIVDTATGALDLFHVLCIFNLLSLAGIAILAKGKYPGRDRRIWVITALQLLVYCAVLAYIVLVLAKAPSFGPNNACNSQVVYVLMFANVHITSPAVRWTFAAILAIALVGGLVSLLSMTRLFFNPRIPQVTGSVDDEDPLRSFFGLMGSIFGSSYFIVMLELTIKRNNLGPGSGTWTFGQVLAMSLLLGPIVELGSLLLGKGD